MKNKKTFFLLTILVPLVSVLDIAHANSAYRYYMLYKTSETYKMIHGDDEDNTNEQQQEERYSPHLDGWGNVVDAPPPPPADYPDYNWDSKKNKSPFPSEE